MVCAIILLLAGFVRYFILGSGGGSSTRNNDPKPLPLAVSKHSDLFNRSMESVLAAYYSLSGSLPGGDAAVINSNGRVLQAALDSFLIKELQVDTIIYQTALQPYENTRAEVAAIIADPSLDEKKSSFNILSNELFSLLSTVRYDLAKVFWLECINAFGEEKPGNWLGNSEKAENPYGQKDCTELKTTLDFVPAMLSITDSTKKK